MQTLQKCWLNEDYFSKWGYFPLSVEDASEDKEEFEQLKSCFVDSQVPEIQELAEKLNSNKMAKSWILSFLESMIATSMGEYLFNIACHTVGYEDGEDAV